MNQSENKRKPAKTKKGFPIKPESIRNKVRLNKQSIRGRLKTRTFRVGGYSVAATLIVLAIAVAVNLLANALPASMTQFDTTSSQLFTISEQTEKILANLDSDVTIYWVVQSGSEDSTLETLLKRYEALSDKISVVKKDPDVSPTFIQQYVSGSLYNNSLIVESKKRFSYISYEDIYEYDYSYYYYSGSYDVSFAGEGVLTSAIDYVVSDEIPRIYALTGHGESSLETSVETAVEKENVELDEVNLLNQGAVPEDADCILIHSPQSDISGEEEEMLLTYLQGGGKMILITGVSQENADFADRYANLSALMGYYGVSAAEGIVIEANANNYIMRQPYYLMPNIGTHTITSPLKGSGYSVLLYIAQGLMVDEELRDGLSVTELLTTSDSAFSKPAGYGISTYEKEEGDIDGPFALAVAITETTDSGEETQIVWVSSDSLISLDSYSSGNQDMFFNMINWMCEKENSISIRSKSLDLEYLTVSSAAVSTLTLLIVGVVPLGYLSIGIYIWIRRKRR